MSNSIAELNAEMSEAKVVREQYQALFSEMVRKTGSKQSVLDRLVQEIHDLRAQVSELEASPLSEEALEILRGKNKQLEHAIDGEMVSCHLGVFGPEDDPREALKKLMAWSHDTGAFFAKDRIEQLEAERDTIAAQNEGMREAIELYFKQYPHMMKGYILDAINSPNLAAEVLKRRDAETLRRAADRFEAVDPHPKHWDWLRRNAAEIDGKETT